MSTTITRGTVTKVERLHNTAVGNPRWKVTLADGREFESESNSTVGYGINDKLVDLATKFWIRGGLIVSYQEEER